MSSAVTGANPSREAAIEITPEPQPMSSRLPGRSSSSSSRQSRVEGCAPVPNARPGSITTVRASEGGASHGGPTQSEPIRTGAVELAPPVLPALLDLEHGGVGELAEHPRCRLAVGGELDDAAGLGLLEPLGSELDEAGSERLGFVGGRGDGGADQWNARFSFSKKPGSWW